jgi:hypothetical protein
VWRCRSFRRRYYGGIAFTFRWVWWCTRYWSDCLRLPGPIPVCFLFAPLLLSFSAFSTGAEGGLLLVAQNLSS